MGVHLLVGHLEAFLKEGSTVKAQTSESIEL